MTCRGVWLLSPVRIEWRHPSGWLHGVLTWIVGPGDHGLPLLPWKEKWRIWRMSWTGFGVKIWAWRIWWRRTSSKNSPVGNLAKLAGNELCWRNAKSVYRSDGIGSSQALKVYSFGRFTRRAGITAVSLPFVVTILVQYSGALHGTETTRFCPSV